MEVDEKELRRSLLGVTTVDSTTTMESNYEGFGTPVADELINSKKEEELNIMKTVSMLLL